MAEGNVSAESRAHQRWSNRASPAPSLDVHALHEGLPWTDAPSAIGSEMKAMYQEDQADRRDGTMHPQIMARDRTRLVRVLELIAEGTPFSPVDRYRAAMVLQHGHLPEHYDLAHRLARNAAENDIEESRWLTASTLDRWCMSREEPQKYGTQYCHVDGSWILYTCDTTTTDAERADWDVPTLEEALRKVDDFNSEDAER